MEALMLMMMVAMISIVNLSESSIIIILRHVLIFQVLAELRPELKYEVISL